MAKWICKISVEIQRLEPVAQGPEGPRLGPVQQVVHVCHGESHGDTPTNAVDQALEETQKFLARLG